MKIDKALLRYYVFDPRLINYGDLCEPLPQTFQVWKAVWENELSAIGRMRSLRADDLIRYDLACCLMYGDQPIGAHLYSFYNLKSLLHRDTHCLLTYFDENSLNLCLSKGCQILMSYEYLTVSPNFRKREVPIRFGDLLLRLGVKVFLSTHAEGIVTCTRDTRRVHEMIERVEFERVRSGFQIHNEDSSLYVYLKKDDLTLKDSDLDPLVEDLWINRVDRRLITKAMVQSLTKGPRPLKIVA